MQPKANKNYYYTINTETKSVIEVNDKKVTTGNKSEIGFVYELVKDSSSNLTIKLTYNKLYIVLQKNGAEDEVIDANTPAAEQTTVEKILSTSKDKSISVILNSKGEIIKTIGSKEIPDKIMTGILVNASSK